jgi:hypothetical protein
MEENTPMWMTQKRMGAGVMVLLLALWGCPGDRPAEDAAPATEATQLTPEQQMQTSLQRVVDAQASHFQDHNRYADSIQILIDNYGFQPVGEEQVVINFQGTNPQWGYVATAVHPFSNQQCEVLHGRSTDGREFAGRIVCEGAAAGPPMPGQAPPAGTGLEPAGTPQPTAPGTGPDAPRMTPPTETDTTLPAQRRP